MGKEAKQHWAQEEVGEYEEEINLNPFSMKTIKEYLKCHK